MLLISSRLNEGIQIARQNPPLLYLCGANLPLPDKLPHPILSELKLFRGISDCKIAFRHKITPAQYHLTLFHIITHQKNKALKNKFSP